MMKAKPVRKPALKQKKAMASGGRCGRYLTNGFADPLRNYAGAYSSKEVKPPPAASVLRKASASHRPKRDSSTKELIFPDFPEFRPNLTPAEVMKLGSFGGTYFRDIYSAPAGKVFRGESVYKELPYKDWGWVAGKGITIPDGVTVATNLPANGFKAGRGAQKRFEPAEMLTATDYHVSQNRFGVKCGGSLDMWESSGWINASDPYGWFQWYCRFYEGRRLDKKEDQRQVQRWLNSAGPKGRFRNQLLNKCKAEGASRRDARVSPVIRQTLQHWGLEMK